MCMIDVETKSLVEKVTKSLVRDGKPFTGYEVALKMAETPDEIWNKRYVSAYVREMFNAGKLPGWASTQVVAGTGPVLYFRVTKKMIAGRRADEIRATLEG